MEMWWKCDELHLVLIIWLTSFENSRLAKNLMFINNDNEQWAIYSQLMTDSHFHKTQEDVDLAENSLSSQKYLRASP